MKARARKKINWVKIILIFALVFVPVIVIWNIPVVNHFFKATFAGLPVSTSKESIQKAINAKNAEIAYQQKVLAKQPGNLDVIRALNNMQVDLQALNGKLLALS